MSEDKGFDRREHMRKVQEKGQQALTKRRVELQDRPEEAPLNGKQKEFCRLYVMEPEFMGNAARCYAKVYLNGEVTISVYNSASDLLKKENIKAEIKALEEERLKAYEHIRYSNIETLLKVRDEMATYIGYAGSDENKNEVSPHNCRATAIRAVETLNKMLGFNKAVEAKGGKTENNQFIFNLVPPANEGEVDTTDLSDFEIEED
jgi:hypothetical protein